MKFEDIKFNSKDSPKGVQAMIDFGLYELSIIQNEMSYGGKKGLFEIAVFKDSEQIELPGITQPGDTVKGFLTNEEVDAILTKMYTITGNKGKQI